jgi:hypothetical protein
LRAATALHHRTGGNPFFLEELLRALPGHDLESLVEQPLPWSLAEVLRRQVDDLEPVSHRIVEAATVLGHRIPFDLLAEVTGTGEDELIAVLRDLVTRGVLVESGDDEFAFRHALVREAIADQMLARTPGCWRTRPAPPGWPGSSTTRCATAGAGGIWRRRPRTGPSRSICWSASPGSRGRPPRCER